MVKEQNERRINHESGRYNCDNYFSDGGVNDCN